MSSTTRSIGPIWTAAQAASALTAVGLIVTAVVAPQLGLFLIWSVLVPVVPLLLLMSPRAWRNLCPVAVAHQLPVRLGFGGHRRLPASLRRSAPIVAGSLFYLIVPLRIALFNDNGTALALLIVGAVLVALFAGVVFLGKSGWCSAFCPVLPVERLYGQDPMLELAHAHCVECAGCVRSCYDLKPHDSLDEMLEPARRRPAGQRGRHRTSILTSPTGLFAAVFPGFVVGYFTTPAGTTWPLVYAWVWAAAAVGALIIAGAKTAFRVDNRAVARACAALAAAAYYWFSVPVVADAAHQLLRIPPANVIGISVARIAFLSGIAVWFVASLRRAGDLPRALPVYPA